MNNNEIIKQKEDELMELKIIEKLYLNTGMDRGAEFEDLLNDITETEYEVYRLKSLGGI